MNLHDLGDAWRVFAPDLAAVTLIPIPGDVRTLHVTRVLFHGIEGKPDHFADLFDHSVPMRPHVLEGRGSVTRQLVAHKLGLYLLALARHAGPLDDKTVIGIGTEELPVDLTGDGWRVTVRLAAVRAVRDFVARWNDPDPVLERHHFEPPPKLAAPTPEPSSTMVAGE